MCGGVGSGMDVTDKALVDSVWDIISNKEAIAVNQAWAGHPVSPPELLI